MPGTRLKCIWSRRWVWPCETAYPCELYFTLDCVLSGPPSCQNLANKNARPSWKCIHEGGHHSLEGTLFTGEKWWGAAGCDQICYETLPYIFNQRVQHEALKCTRFWNHVGVNNVPAFNVKSPFSIQQRANLSDLSKSLFYLPSSWDKLDTDVFQSYMVKINSL